MEADEDDYPFLGKREDDSIVVALGDDFPDQWEPWLGEFVHAIHHIDEVAADAGLDLGEPTGSSGEETVRNCCESIGISWSTDFWEGDHTSGHFVIASVPVGTLASVQRKGAALVKRLRSKAERLARQRLFHQMKREDLDTLAMRLASDPKTEAERATALERKIESLQKSLAVRGDELASAQTKSDTEARNAERLLEFLSSVIAQSRETSWAGPFGWSAGHLVVLSRLGNEPIPYPLYATCLNSIKASGVRVSEIVDETVALRSPGSGTPYPFKWPEEPDDVWILRSPFGERNFRGEGERSVDVARTVHQAALAAKSMT